VNPSQISLSVHPSWHRQISPPVLRLRPIHCSGLRPRPNRLEEALPLAVQKVVRLVFPIRVPVLQGLVIPS